VVSALLPRDIIWRTHLIGALGTLWLLKIELAAWEAVLYTAVLLIASVLPQAIDLIRATAIADRAPLTVEQKAEFAKVTQGLWGITAVPPALGQVSTLMIAAILGPEVAGAVFVAERTTRLINVALNGINQALAPEISSGFHRGDIRFVRRLSHLTALGASAAALAVFVMFWFFGKEILAIFEPSYATQVIHATLLVFCLGTMVTCASGPVEILMQVTGMQHRLLRILVIVQPIGLVVTAILTYLVGPVGAAIGISVTLTTWVVMAVFSIRRDLKVDPTLIGYFREARSRA
jgi:O-antigen/teichoic acid export membrane protein